MPCDCDAGRSTGVIDSIIRKYTGGEVRDSPEYQYLCQVWKEEGGSEVFSSPSPGSIRYLLPDVPNQS